MGKTQKYYVVWNGRETGVFTSWEACKKQIAGFKNAQYKSFKERRVAEEAFTKSYSDYKGVGTSNKKRNTVSDKKAYGQPILKSVSVDAACSGNPGKMEYRGVLTDSKKELFKQGVFENGTNNIGEFLAIVHALALLKRKGITHLPIYSDSKIAITWVQKKQCRTNLVFNDTNKDLLDLIKRAEKWLHENSYTTSILKWETKAWGEIPADFGRK